MAHSPVSWSYGELLSTHKLAQMEENTRVHNHADSGQGAQLGLRASAGGRVTGVAPSVAANGTGTVTITFPAGRFTTAPHVFPSVEESAVNRVASVVSTTLTEAVVAVFAGSTAIGAGGVAVQWDATESSR